MTHGLSMLLEGLAWPELAVAVGGIALLGAYWNWIVKLSPQQREDVKRKWWAFALMAVAMLAGLSICRWYRHRPLPKERGHVRLLVAPQADTPVGREVSLALIPKLQRLLEPLRIEQRVEVWLVPAMGTGVEAEDVIRSTNADAMLWVSSVSADSMTGVIHPRWYMRALARPLFYSQLTPRPFDARNAASLNFAIEQIALESLDMLRPSLGDWLEEADDYETRTGLAVRLPGRRKSLVDLTLTVSRWSPAGGAPGRTTEVLAGEHLLYAMWACNRSGKTLSAVSLVNHLPPGTEYLPGLLTLNGDPLSELGPVAIVDDQHSEVTFSLGDFEPNQRALVTVGVTLKQ